MARRRGGREDDGDEGQGDPGGGRPTRAERRRHGERSGALARKLLALSEAELEGLSLPEAVVDELAEARRIHSAAALRRQERRLAQVLRDEDLDAVAAALEQRRREQAEEAQRFQRVEHWRERLLSSDDPLAELLALVPAVDERELRALVQDARQERDRGRPKGAGRTLFRRLREWLSDGGPQRP